MCTASLLAVIKTHVVSSLHFRRMHAEADLESALTCEGENVFWFCNIGVQALSLLPSVAVNYSQPWSNFVKWLNNTEEYSGFQTLSHWYDLYCLSLSYLFSGEVCFHEETLEVMPRNVRMWMFEAQINLLFWLIAGEWRLIPLMLQ